jgi:hypothetical protein
MDDAPGLPIIGRRRRRLRGIDEKTLLQILEQQGNRKKFFLGGWIVDFDFDFDFELECAAPGNLHQRVLNRGRGRYRGRKEKRSFLNQLG